ERDYRHGYLQTMSLRNSYLFHWKNLTERKLFVRHLASIPRRVAQDTLVGGGRSEYSAFIAALGRLRKAAAGRVLERSFTIVSDSEVLRYANG
ncbi:MAG: hypothetical protein GTO55_07455, partial [Armatimonadetes bacterium]|nr:hypothetical protein [Armatimonadota bacterium]NIO56801.1 hypothetical protein [Candidatus Latescibacterota bacterium]NIM24105.1 hypothetical protein [Armatimonadota bacterium]NIM67960.1 hypothetical protein [Armatimonadota bacterium]NIM76481.1 hypothetical protein [Armatimonadota bacterium]